MTDQLTTIASLPSGAGQAAHLPPEIGRPRQYSEGSTVSINIDGSAFDIDMQEVVRRAVLNSMRKLMGVA